MTAMRRWRNVARGLTLVSFAGGGPPWPSWASSF
jgi:hypothetical protein